tara:strand:+ start:103 stop:210 length:108 start_codon:yes stop_codon:yes gene_type:complete
VVVMHRLTTFSSVVAVEEDLVEQLMVAAVEAALVL